MSQLSVETFKWCQWPEVAPIWERVYNKCPESSFFLSRDWVDCWLATFGGDLQPDLLTFVRGGEVVGCCLLVWRTQRVRGIPLRRVYLNCAGENDADGTCMEYNSLLSYPDCAQQVADALEAFLSKSRWDELHLQGITDSSPVHTLASSLGNLEVETSPSRFVDLSRIREDARGFDGVLSSNTRHQIRRSLRLYENRYGRCDFRVAETDQEAAEIFSRLTELHQTAWQDRGQPGVFASPQFTGFHRRLIQTAFTPGRIMLAEVRSGTEVIETLYSFLHRGRLYSYQSGFRYEGDARLKPGLLTHYLAIRHCIEQSTLREYDFLAGESQYKGSLATDSRRSCWIVCRRPTVPCLLFVVLRSAKRTYVRMAKKGHGEN